MGKRKATPPPEASSSTEVSVSTPKKRRASKKPEGTVGGRRRGFCDIAPIAVQERVDRVMSQRMFLVDRRFVGTPEEPKEEFKVLGSTGNVYTVTIGAFPACDCPDCKKGNVPCKHIIFIFLKVLKVAIDNVAWFQRHILPDELLAIYLTAPRNANGVGVPEAVRNAFLHVTGAEPPEVQTPAEVGPSNTEDKPVQGGERRLASIGEDCAICFDEMSQEQLDSGELVFDESMTGCGKPLHKECFDKWASNARAKGTEVTCVWCRSVWIAAGAKRRPEDISPAKGKSGYMNLADVMGINKKRDTSTYYHGPRRRGSGWYRYDADDD